ncbi:MAG: multidrug efflux system membrane fusion protein [Paraglaciecola sp.]|jgi:multidrug efflux system membrane fusion protein
MKNKWMKIGLPILALGLGMGGMLVIEASATEEKEKAPLDTRPTVKVEMALAQDYQVQITGYGEVKPLEKTTLSAQVSGEVVSWHANFVAGGLVLRGSTLFSIEKDTYQAALLQAQANVSLAQAQLIEEQARADVAKEEAKGLPNSKVSDLYLRKPQLMSAQASLKSAQAGLQIAQRDLNNCTVTAPYDALVVSRELGVGQFISRGDRAGELYNVEAAEIIFPIAGFDREFLPTDLAFKDAIVSTNGYNAITRQGIITRDLGLVDQGTRMGQLVVQVNDPYGLKTNKAALKFGSYVQVSFAGLTLNNIYRLPQDLVNNRVVWVVDNEQKLRSQKVQILREEDEYFLINQGINDEDQVVITLPEYPQSGMEVKIAAKEELTPSQTDEG